MIRSTALVSIIYMGFMLPAHAVEPKSVGWFIGGSVGDAEFDDDGAFNGLSFDDSDTSFGILGGYKFMEHFAVEARYADTGSYDVSGPGGSVDFDTDVLSVHAVGIIPFGVSGWSIYGQLGLGRVELDADGALDDDDDETVGSAGLGVSYNATEDLSFAFQVDAYAWEDDDGPDDYDVAITIAQLVVRYAF